MAIAGANTASGKAMLLINPHTSFFFREEAQMVSEEGLNAYGALTWGQFFIYQGFNDKVGWMHTTSSVDNIDEYLETVTKKADGTYTYKVGTEERPLQSSDDHRAVQDRERAWRKKDFTVYKTHRGPIVARDKDGQVGQHPHDAGADEGVDAVVQPHQGAQPRRVQEGDGPPHQLVEQHAVRRRPTATSPSSTRTSFRSAIRSSTGPSRWTAPIRPPSGTACCRSTNRRTSSIRRTAGSTTPTTIRSRPPGKQQPEAEGLPAVRRSRAPRIRAACTPIRVLDGKKGLTLDTLITDVAYDSYMPEFEIQIPLLLKAHAARAGVESAQGEDRRCDRGAEGLGLPLVGDVGADVGGDVLR